MKQLYTILVFLVGFPFLGYSQVSEPCLAETPVIQVPEQTIHWQKPFLMESSGCTGGLVLWFLEPPTDPITNAVEMGKQFRYTSVDTVASKTIYCGCFQLDCLSPLASYTIRYPPTTVIASTTPNLNDLYPIVPPSANAASLGAYGTTPVSNYSGVAQTSIPIYTIEDRDLRLPLSLSYLQSGIRVEQEASNVGLGWAMQSGGVITRSIRRMDDLNEQYGWAFHPVPAASTINQSYLNSFCTLSSTSHYNLDSEPDIFSYRVGEYSGTFILKSQNAQSFPIQAQLLEQSDVKIEVNKLWGGSYPQYEWVLYTPTGQVYKFREQEQSQQIGIGDGGNQTLVLWPQYYEYHATYPASMTYDANYYSGQGITAWYLNEVSSLTSQASITLEYDVANLYYSSSMVNANELVLVSSTGTCGPEATYNQNSLSYSAIVSSQVYLKRIVFSRGEVTFTYSDREDIAYFNPRNGADYYPFDQSFIGSIESRINNRNGQSLVIKKPQKLDAILVKDPNGTEVYRWVLGYSYFNEFQAGVLPSNPSPSDKLKRYRNLRLRLNSFSQFGSSGTVPQYRFYYTGDNVSNTNELISQVVLPTKTSQAKDYFGYYNGMENNNSLFYYHIIPDLYYPKLRWNVDFNANFYSTYLGYGHYFSNINRDVNTETLAYGSLSRVVYPTGGQTDFSYECHQAFTGANEVSIIDQSASGDMTTNFSVPLVNGGYSQFYQGTLLSYLRCSLYQTCQESPSGIQIFSYGTGCNDIPTAYGNTWYAQYITPSNTIPFAPTFSQWANKVCLPDRTGLSSCANFDGDYRCEVSSTMNITLSPGLNQLKTQRLPVTNAVDYPLPSVHLLAAAYMTQDYEVRSIGGLRIARIDHSTNDGQVYSKKYRYLLPNGQSSGKLLKPFVRYNGGYEGYLRKQYEQNPSLFSCYSTDPSVIRWGCEISSSTLFPLGSEYSGQVVGYSQVSVEEYDNYTLSSLNGQVVYTYLNEKDTPPTNLLFPQIPSIPNLSNGSLSSETHYDKTGAKVSETLNTYAQRTSSSELIGAFRYLNCGSSPTTMYYSYYHIPSDFWYLSSSTNRLYHGASYTETIQQKKYLSASHTQLSEFWESTGGMDGEWVRTSYQYPYDFSTDVSMQSLTSQNRVGEIVRINQEFIQASNGTILSSQPLYGQKKSYSLVNGVYLPTQVESQYEGGAWQTEVSQVVYSAQNQVIQAMGKDQKKRYYTYYGSSDVGKRYLLKEIATGNGINTSLQNIEHQSYDYSILKGLSQLTLPNGLGSSFTFDELGRLSAQKDANLSLTATYNYHYRSSSTCSPPAAPTISIGSSSLCSVTLTAAGCSGGIINWSNGASGTSISVGTAFSQSYTATCSQSGCTSVPSAAFTLPTLPSSWSSVDIGFPTTGCTQYLGGSLTSLGNGLVYGTSDAFHYIYKPMSGDFTMIAKISSLAGVDGLRGGLMIRSNLNADAAYYTLIQDGNANVGELKRATNGGSGNLYSFFPESLNQTWIKVVKTGNSIKGYHSSDPNPEANNAWNDYFNLTQTSPTILDFGSNYYLGFAVWGTNNTMTFTNITLNGQPF